MPHLVAATTTQRRNMSVLTPKWLVLVISLLSFLVEKSETQTEINLVNRSGTIQIPGYPGEYANNLQITWVLSAASPMQFLVRLIRFDMEDSDNCKNDKLAVRRKSGWYTYTEQPVVCGSIETFPNRTFAWNVLSYHLEVVFESDTTLTGSGFIMEYEVKDVANEIICQNMRRGAFFQGSISSEFMGDRDRYPANLNCSWEVYINPGSELQIVVSRFEMEIFRESCDMDGFSVYRAVQANEEEHIDTFCGKRMQWTIAVSDSSSARLAINTDDMDNLGGFVIDFYPRAAPSDVPFAETVSYRIRGKRHGDLLASPQWGNLTALQNPLTWHLRADPGFRIRIRAHTSAPGLLQGATITFYDSPTDQYPDSSRHFLASQSLDRTSSGFHVLLKLSINTMSQLGHLNMTYETFNFFLTDAIHFRYLDIGDYTFVQNPSQIFRCCVYYILVAPHGKTIAFDLNDFGLFDGLPNDRECSRAGVVVFDGGFAPNQTIGPVCDTTSNRLYDMFDDFVSASSTIYVFLYGYTTEEGRRRFDYELEPWPTTCQVEHVTEASLPWSTPDFPPGFGLTIPVSPSHGPRDCFILYVHPWKAAEPRVEFTIDDRNISATLCDRWSLKPFVRDENKTTLPVETSKLSNQLKCHSNARISSGGTRVYAMSGNIDATWSQRVGRLAVGDVGSHLCGQLPECREQQMFPSEPCGTIIHFQSSCSWFLPGVLESTPFYWEVEILFATLSKNAEARSCHVAIREVIGRGRIAMETRFLCTELNLSRLRRYRTMEANSYLLISNTVVLGLKLRYRKRYIDTSLQPAFGQGPETLNGNNTCSGKSIYFKDHCYAFHRKKRQCSWRQAENACVGKGGHLLSITTTQELDFIKKALLYSSWNQDFFQTPLGLLYVGLSDIHKPGEYRWEDGNPLSVADWYHAWDHDNNILPHQPALPINSQVSEPAPDRSKRCVAMAVGNAHYSTNWVKIRCFKKYARSSFICKWPALKSASNESRSSKNTSDTASETTPAKNDWLPQSNDVSAPGRNDSLGNDTLYGCPENWTYIKGGCYSLISEDIDLHLATPMLKAGPLCAEIGGDIAQAELLPVKVLLQYLQLWGVNPGDGNVWVRMKDGRIGCTSVSTLLQKIDGVYVESNDTNCVLNEARVGFVLCSADLIELSTSCLEHQFRCHDGTCLQDVSICDGRRDCFDGEDEFSCGNLQDDLFFSCGDDHHISVSDVCDFWPDCANGSDVTGCRHRECLSGEFQCRNGQCIPAEHKCDFVTHCLDASDENQCDWGVDVCRGFECPGGHCLPADRVTDLVPDCPDGTEADEKSKEHFRLSVYVFDGETWDVKSDNTAWCHGSKLTRRCHRDRVTCTKRANMCVYDQNEQGDVLFCRDGTHLLNCEDYECRNMFKCPKSYCIPWYKVCDGRSDCAGGADEINCERYSCPGRLRCKGSYQCVTQDQICDGRVHCRGSFSDEQFCDKQSWVCPHGCNCHGYAIDCRQGNLTRTPDNLLENTRILLLQENRITIENTSFYNLTYLLVLRLNENGIAEIPEGSFSNLANLHTLDLRSNSIRSLYANMFDGLVSLMTLLMDGNPLQVLPGKGFVGLNSIHSLNLSGLGINKVETNALSGLPNLERLDLSKNKITVLEQDSLPTSSHMSLVYLTGNTLEDTKVEVFRSVTARKLWTDSYRFCCFVDSSRVDECYPSSDVFSSCEDLLSTVILRAFVWFLGLTCILGNTMVFVWRIYSGFRNRPSVYILNLSISDTLMGVYLVILASTDTYYRGNYILYDQEWRQGGVCQLLGILTTVSCQMSMFTLLALAWDRFLTVKFPFSVALNTVRGSWILTVGLWLFSVTLALIPVALQDKFENFYGKNSICMPFNFTHPRSAGWEYATVVFVGLNGVCLAVMIVLYAIIYCRVRDSQMNVGRTDRSDLVVARRLSIVLITNIVSWIPIILANIISVTVGPLTREMAAILTTVILPLNPALNPYLYTFSSCIKRDNKPVEKKATANGRTSQTHL